jgi:hypothetical protein
MADHQIVIARRGAGLKQADLLVRATNPDIQHPQHHMVWPTDPGDIQIHDLDSMRPRETPRATSWLPPSTRDRGSIHDLAHHTSASNIRAADGPSTLGRLPEIRSRSVGPTSIGPRSWRVNARVWVRAGVRRRRIPQRFPRWVGIGQQSRIASGQASGPVGAHDAGMTAVRIVSSESIQV